MTNASAPRAAGLAVALLAAVAALAPLAQAHGAPAQREVDTRVLLDDDGLVAYAGGGLDLLALDVREAWLGDQEAIVFRFVLQSDEPPAGRGVELTVGEGAAARTYAAGTQDGAVYTSTTFARLDGPFDVGDGHPKALDAWVPLADFGAQVGQELAGITVRSVADGASDDVMPGGWYQGGQEVPHVPHDPADPAEAVAEQGPGTYAVKGPAPLVALAAAATVIDLARDPEATLTLSNPLGETEQFVEVTLVAAAGVQASLDGADANGTLGLRLAAGATRDLTIQVDPASPAGSLTVVAASDLGGRALSTLQVAAAPAPSSTMAPTPGGDATPAKDAAAPALPLAVAGLAALLATTASRRRGR